MTFGGKYYTKANKLLDKGDIVEGMKVFKKGMEDGDVLCTCSYARRLQEGWGVLMDKKKAQKLYASVFKKLEQHNVDTVEAGAGDLESIRWQGHLHKLYDEEYSPESVEFCYNYAAERGDVYSMEALLEFYVRDVYRDNNDQLMQNIPLALEWGLKAIANGGKDAYLAVAKCYLELKDEANFKKYIKLAEKKGSINQLQRLGIWYYNGDYLKEDLEKAAKLLKIAGKAGDPYAMAIYADCMLLGHGIKQDTQKALDILTELSAISTRAIEAIANSFANGIGVEKNINQALKLFKKAADCGDDYAQSRYDELFAQTTEGKEKKLYDDIYAQMQNGDVEALWKMGKLYEHGQGCKKDLKKAFEWYKKACESGTKMGQTYYARCFSVGIGVKQDYAKAFELNLKFAKEGNEECMANVSVAYANGRGVPQDDKKAYEWTKKAADLGCKQGLYNLAACYDNGTGVEQDFDKAKNYFKKAADLGHDKACGSVAYHYMCDKDYANGYKYAKKGDELGDGFATSIMGSIYRLGWGVKQDYKKAFNYYKKRPDNKNCQYYIGTFFDDDNNGVVKKDLKKAFEWYKKSADNGCDLAYRSVGNGYYFGRGTKVDLKLACEYYIKAVESGDESACVAVGNCFDRQEKPDHANAFKWYYRGATKANEPTAQCNLGICYELGEGVAIDLTAATEWYVKAANGGDAMAAANAGYMYESGRGVKKDYATAAKYYKMAADKGLARGQFLLGECYRKGLGVKQSYQTAAKYYQLAVDQDFRDAQYQLGMLYLFGRGVDKDIEKALINIAWAAKKGNASAQFDLGVCYANGEGVGKDTNKAIYFYKMAAQQGHKKAIEYLKELGVYF